MALRAVVAAAILQLPWVTLGQVPRQTIGGALPPAWAAVQPIGSLSATQTLCLAIGLPLRDQDGLNALLAQLWDPASTNFHQWLTTSQFTERFGPTEDDYQALAGFALSNGLAVARGYPNRLVLDVSGPVASIERIFNVHLLVYQHPTEPRTFYAPDAVPSVPLAVPILGVEGLNNYYLPRPGLALPSPQAPSGAGPDGGTGPSGNFIGIDFRAAYAPGCPLTGAGQILGLVEFDGYGPQDIAYYEQAAGLPTVLLTNVLVDGAAGTPGGYGDLEVCVDIEMVIAMAPGLSEVIVYVAPVNEVIQPASWYDLLDRIATDNLAKQVSCSWRTGPSGPCPVEDAILQEMVAQGQSFFAASGDYDAYPPGSAIPWPLDNPYATVVGGTRLFTTSGGAYDREEVWSAYNGSAVGSGGGVSASYSLPRWQAGVATPANGGSSTMRNTPDVAMVATNIYARYDGVDTGASGTSAAAPLWAAFAALMNQQGSAETVGSTVGFLNPWLYRIGDGPNYSSEFNPTPGGNNVWSDSPNEYYAVTSGYDLCTGWGSPGGTNLINDPFIAGAPEVSAVALTQTSFSFQITLTFDWAVWASEDLVNWTEVLTGSGSALFRDSAVSGVASRAYCVVSGAASHPVGFVRVEVPPGGSALIANQFDEPSCTLDGLFNPMPDGTFLPDGVEIYLWDRATQSWGSPYTWASGAWSPSPGKTNLLWTGQGAFFYNPSGTSATITFCGLIRQGWLNLPLAANVQLAASSLLPQSGGVTSVMGYAPSAGDWLTVWNQAQNGWEEYTYVTERRGQPVAPYWSPQEPVLGPGQAFIITPASANLWSQYSWIPTWCPVESQ